MRNNILTLITVLLLSLAGTEVSASGVPMNAESKTGYAPIHGMQLYYEIHGQGKPIDTKLLAKIVGKDRTVDQATRSEKRAASVGLHSFRHTNATAMDSLGIPQQIRKQRLGHSGNSVTENYTHTFTKDERDAAERLGEFFGTGWPETGQGKVISFPNLSQKEEGLPAGAPEALVNQ